MVLTANDSAGPANSRGDMTIRLKFTPQRKPSQVALPNTARRKGPTATLVARKTRKTRLLPTRRVTTKPRPSQVSLLFWSSASLALTLFGKCAVERGQDSLSHRLERNGCRRKALGTNLGGSFLQSVECEDLALTAVASCRSPRRTRMNCFVYHGGSGSARHARRRRPPRRSAGSKSRLQSRRRRRRLRSPQRRNSQ